MGLTVIPLVGAPVIAAVLIAWAVTAIRAGRPAADLSPRDRTPVRVEGVVVDLGGRRILDGVDLTAPPGRILGLLGPNGVGKSTLLRVVSGLVVPDAGTVEVYGHRVFPSAPILQQVGVSIGRPGVLPHLTGRQNLEAAWAVTGRPRAQAHLDMVVDRAGLGAALDRRAGTYSEGQKQSLALATAMLGMPDVLLLDEPTNALDPLRTRQVRSALRDYADSGRTVVITTHRMGEAQLLCDDIAVMLGGRIALYRTDPPRPAAPAPTELEQRYLALLARSQRADCEAGR